MDAIERLITVARRRSRLQAALQRGVRAGILLAAVAWLLAVIDRLPAEPLFNWWWIGGGLALFVVLDAILAWWKSIAL